MDSRQLKRLGDMCKRLSRVDAGFGAVQLRRKIGALSWGVNLFGERRPYSKKFALFVHVLAGIQVWLYQLARFGVTIFVPL